jgi:DNA polymerase III alpha subunit (gram-positive type)
MVKDKHKKMITVKDKFKDLLFLDVEATGLEEEDRLVQVAYTLNGEEHEDLFHPGREMSIRAMEVTHITNKHLVGKQPFKNSNFCKKLKEHLEHESTIFVAHNAQFDRKMLEREGLVVKKEIDTYKVAQALDVHGDIPAYRLQYLRYHLGIELDDACAHTALGDVRVLTAIFERMYDKMAQKFAHDEILARMIDISSKPVLLKRITFGKYRDMAIADVARQDRGYLEWLLGQKESDAANGKIDEDWIYTLKHYLE